MVAREFAQRCFFAQIYNTRIPHFELKRLNQKLDIVEKPENRVHKLTYSNGGPYIIYYNGVRDGLYIRVRVRVRLRV